MSTAISTRPRKSGTSTSTCSVRRQLARALDAFGEMRGTAAQVIPVDRGDDDVLPGPSPRSCVPCSAARPSGSSAGWPPSQNGQQRVQMSPMIMRSPCRGRSIRRGSGTSYSKDRVQAVRAGCPCGRCTSANPGSVRRIHSGFFRRVSSVVGAILTGMRDLVGATQLAGHRDAADGERCPQRGKGFGSRFGQLSHLRRPSDKAVGSSESGSGSAKPAGTPDNAIIRPSLSVSRNHRCSDSWPVICRPA